jgi:acetylornithine deacetylase/succinyl-diaminopimelate desuccinylase-like protein
MIEDVLRYVERNTDNAIEELKEIVRIPSVAAKNEGLDEAAEFLEGKLEALGLEAKLHETTGAPVVTGYLDVGAKRTLMFYDHYDVQPAEPFDLWETPPFEPDIREGRIYGRGVADNKGDTISRLWALKGFIDTGTNFPVNIKCIFEGEEEIGSIHFPEFVKRNKEFMKADGGIWEFGGEGYDGVQEAWLGLKGIFYVQLEIELLTRDVHSSMGCVLPSAPQRLVMALKSLKAADHRILIDGFYDGIKPLTDVEWDAIDKIDLREEDIKENYGVKEFLNGMTGRDFKEAYYNAPTCTICGLTSGYQGKGSMTVLPAKASAKIDFRLVDGMDPEDIKRKFRRHLDSHGFSDIKFLWYEGYPAGKTPVDHPFVNVVRRANSKEFHDLRVHPTSPGSGPLYLFKGFVPMVSIGVSDFNSKGHSPNESIKLENFRKGMLRLVHLIDEMGRW